MKNKVALIAIVVGIVFVVSLYYLGHTSAKAPNASTSDSLLNSRFGVLDISMHAGNVVSNYSVYLATTPAQLQEGYMNVSTTGNCNNEGNCLGMLFEFSNESNLCFWMDNTLIPLRQTWFNSSGYPVYVYNGTPLSKQVVCHYGEYVLETNLNFTAIGYMTLGTMTLN